MTQEDDVLFQKIFTGLATDRLSAKRRDQLFGAIEQSLPERSQELSARPMAQWTRLLRRVLEGVRAVKPAYRLVAAVAVGAALLVVLLMPGGTGHLALADVQRALERVPWVRITGRMWILKPGAAAPEEREGELWYGFAPLRSVRRATGGEVYFGDAGQKRAYRYDPETRTVTVRYRSEGPFDDVSSPAEGFAKLLEAAPLLEWASAGQGRRERQGRTVDVLTFERQADGEKYMAGVDKQRFVVAVDLLTHLPVEVSTTGWRKDVVVLKASGVIDYPASGPESIYDLGVPRTAKVSDDLPGNEVMSLQDSIQERLDRFGPVYEAIMYGWNLSITTDDGRDESYIFHIRKGHDRLRMDVYDYLASGETQPVVPNEAVPAQAHDLAAVKARMTPERFYWALLVTDEWVYRRGAWGSKRGGLVKVPRTLEWRPKENFLTHWMWPGSGRIRYRSLHLLEPDPPEAGLLCLERKHFVPLYARHQGEVVRFVSCARDRFYINPERDYIAERYESEFRITEIEEAPDWHKHTQEDRVASSLPPQRLRVRTVLRYAQTEAGQWYPNELRQKHYAISKTGDLLPQEPEEFWYIHLETRDSIPDDVFDPDSLAPAREE